MNRVLLTRMKFIGDIVLTTPVIRSLRTALPHAYIAYLGDRNAVSLLEHNPFLNEIISYDFSRPTMQEQWRVAWLLRRRKFDVVIDLFGNPRSALLSYLSGAQVRVGPDRKGRGRFYTLRVRDDGKPKTSIAFHNQSLTAIGIQPSTVTTELFLTTGEREQAWKALNILLSGGVSARGSTPIVCLHPGATWPAKKWLPERFAELADRLHVDHGVRVVLTGGPGDADTVAEVCRYARTAPCPVGLLPLRQLAALLSHCSAVVSNDAGPMHIAVAVGTPTIGIFGPGEESIWFPYPRERGHRALRMDVPCHPCHLDICNRRGEEFMECMKLLLVDDVVKAVAEAVRVRHKEV